MTTTHDIAAQMVADINASRHYGLVAHERLRNDKRLAWLKSQKGEDADVSSMGGLLKYWNDPQTFRRRRIISLIAAREQQLRDYPGSFRWWMHEARKARRNEMDCRAEIAPKPVTVDDVADMVCARIVARSVRAPMTELDAARFIKTGALPKQKEQVA